MAYRYSLKYQQNLVTGHRPGSGIFQWSKRHGRSTKMCPDFTINDAEGITPNNVPLFAVKQRKEEWLFGPATSLTTRSIIYPCSKSRCSLPCPCLLCHHRQHPRCRVPSEQSCVCQDCQKHYMDHVNFHSVFHYGCKQCHQIMKIIPNCNFAILNMHQKRGIPGRGHLPEVYMCAQLKETSRIIRNGVQFLAVQNQSYCCPHMIH